jgi:signal transduction histidine kinase
LNREPLLYNLRPTAAQIRTTSLVASLTVIGFLATLPFARLQLGRIDAFIPVVDSLLFLGDLIIATLLLAEALVLRSKPLMALGTGYFFTSLIIIPHALTYPYAFSQTGLLGAGLSTPNWLYYFWHCGLPVSVIAYALLKNCPNWSQTAALSPRQAMALCLISAAALVGVLTLVATIGEPLLPQMMADPIHGYAKKVIEPAIPVALLLALAMAMTWRRRSSVLDLWLLFALSAWFLELLTSAILTHSRFALGWYSGRILGLLSGLYVLLMLLGQTSRLYMRAVLQVRARLWERENRLMVRDAVAASIGHELRQPLGAIMLNAAAALRHVPKPDAFVSSVLNDVLADSQRAAEIMEGMRAIFDKSVTQKKLTSINRLVGETLAMISRELHDLGVSVDLKTDPSLPPIAVNVLQIEQVLFNLFINAGEAMKAAATSPRVLTIRSASDDKGIVIWVEDTGPGISAKDQERIFDIFYTTKGHGTGLGLSICRSIITAHGGSLAVITRKPRGASFEIHLPFGGSAEQPLSSKFVR